MQFVKRNKIVYSIAVIVVIVLGLSSRKYACNLPDFINTYLSDGLWALMIFLLVALIFNHWKTTKVAVTGLAFCYAIEISQLYHAPWINQIRNTTLGGLVLGFGFLWTDIVAYTLGIGFGVLVELIIRKNIQKEQV